MKTVTTNSAQLKTEIHNLALARQSIQKASDVSGSIVKLHKTLTNIQPLIKKQQSIIKNFYTQQQSSSAQNKQQESRRYLNRICEVAMQDISGLLEIGQQYFTIDFKNSWTKIKNQFQKQFNSLKEELDNRNVIQFLFKIVNCKDYFIANFMKSILYRKCLLWKDLNIAESGFIHSEHKEVLKLLENQKLQKGYVPTKPMFDWMGFNVKGSWNINKMDVSQFDIKSVFKITNESVETMLSVLRNYANLTVEQREHEDIDRNKDKVKSLRQEIEQGRINYLNLEKKYRQAVLKDEKSADLLELREKVTLLQDQLESAQNQLKKVKFEFRDSSNQINSLTEKIGQLQADLNRVNNMQMKKLKQLESVQNNLNEQFNKIYKNISNFGSMFEFQSDDKKSLAKDIIGQSNTIQKIASLLGREKNKNRDLQQQITRLNIIILQLGNKLKKGK